MSRASTRPASSSASPRRSTRTPSCIRWCACSSAALPESQRKAFLFENVIDSKGRKYDIPVLVGALAGSAGNLRARHGLRDRGHRERLAHALAKPIAPVAGRRPAPCQEVVITGDELERDGGGLGRLPIPISTPGFDNAPYTTAVALGDEASRHRRAQSRQLPRHGEGGKPHRRAARHGSAVGMREHIDRWRDQGRRAHAGGASSSARRRTSPIPR